MSGSLSGIGNQPYAALSNPFQAQNTPRSPDEKSTQKADHFTTVSEQATSNKADQKRGGIVDITV